MDVVLKYGGGKISIAIPEKARTSILEPLKAPVLASVKASLEQSLAEPLGSPSLEKIVSRSRPRSIAIAVPDETRPAPLGEILPPLLSRIEAGLSKPLAETVTFFIGGGLHPPADAAAVERILPASVTRGCPVKTHDARSAAMRDYGVTLRGTPVRINGEYAGADLKMVIGQVDPHQFVGFTGGSKGVVIGCGAPETIEKNHSLMSLPNAQVGRLKSNPVREDLTEAGEMVGIDLAINFVLDADRRVVHLAAGAPSQILESCAEVCAGVYGVAIEEKFDIVLASCGGFPKDICLYQAQKGLNLASQALNPGGRILLLAASPQGVGDDIYFDYVSQFTRPEEVIRDFKSSGFRMGAHKAYLFGRTLVNYDVAVFSELDPGILRKCHLRAADPNSILKEWVADFEGIPKVAIIPQANTTYFYEVRGIRRRDAKRQRKRA
ncbi:MAG: transcriptional regulator [Deltaproteobacteria bacterium HGW-Deltaproteobacteria-15]|nr:MAG: transcriptional regulator [Deltaproteobacteria bacterium HGW-Deltaproteobacteria-15]